jgi:hypothetical protein
MLKENIASTGPANGQGAEHEHVAAIGKGGVPAEHAYQAGDGHRGFDEKVLEHVRCGCGDGSAAPEKVGHREGAEEADGEKDGGELSHKA